ncbi:SurA N-terminal domain-containing protein [Octadecabacter sp. R77987]|uniref:peptidylprolyl isomerase n=1 Tax=Octadecabacter sp. R77987 TaxID=3093874 RepID=UPI00366D9779
MARSKTSSFFVWIILGLLFVGLMGFGAAGLSGNVRTLGTVGDKDIAVRDYQNALRDQIASFEATIGTPISFVQAQSIGLDQQVLSQVIATRALDNEAGALGLSVGDDRVRDQVLQIPAFRGVDNTFSREGYAEALRRAGLNEAEFETGLREEMARTLLQGAVVSGVQSPDAFASALAQFAGESRSFTWAVVDAAMLAEPLPEPSDADLAAFYEANPAPFTSLETRTITYASLTPEMIQDDVTVDEEELRQAYADNIADFVQAERRLVERLVYADGDRAQAAADRVAAGEVDFEGLVGERGLDLAQVDMGDVDEAELRTAGPAVFAAELGDVVGPLDTSLGPALFRVNAVLAAQEVTFEEARDDLREERAAARARRIIEDSIDGVNDLLAGGATLADLAERTDMQLGTLEWDVETSDGIAAYAAFRDAAGNTDAGAFPELLELEDGGIFALQVDAVTAPALRPLDTVRADVIAAWEAAQTQDMVMAQARTLADQIDADTDLATLDLSPNIEAGQTRRGFIEGTPPGFLESVFEMATGDVAVVDRAGNGAIIVRLDAIAAPDTADETVAAQQAQIAETAAAGIAQDIFEIFNRDVQIRTDVEINQNAVNAVHATFQ